MQIFSWLTKRRQVSQALARIDAAVGQRLADREPVWAARNAELQRDYVPSTQPAEAKATAPSARHSRPTPEAVPDYIR